jgi:hypothetical protein
MVNNGTPRAAAKPFLSNAWDARIVDATKAAEERFDEGLQSVIGAAT